MNHQQMIKPMLIGAAILAALGIAGLPVGNVLPFLVLLACPLMMIFMMRGMSHGGGEQSHRDDQSDQHATSDRRVNP